MLGELPRVVAPTSGAQLLVMRNGILPKIILQRYELLDVLRQGLYHRHAGVHDRRTAMCAGNSERSRRVARRQSPRGPVHLQPDAMQLVELRVCPWDKRCAVPEARRGHHMHGGHHLPQEEMVPLCDPDQLLGGREDVTLLLFQTRRGRASLFSLDKSCPNPQIGEAFVCSQAD